MVNGHLSACRQFIPNAMHGFNNIFTADFREFLANMPNMAIDCAITHIHITVVSAVHDAITAKNARRLASEHLQHGKFRRC